MNKLNPVQANQVGVARTFQNIRLFSNMSVLDNVKTGMHNELKYGLFTSILRLPKYYKLEKESTQKAMELLKIFGLDQFADLTAGNCERITVLNFGQALAQGLPQEIQSNKEVIKAYIGE